MKAGVGSNVAHDRFRLGVRLRLQQVWSLQLIGAFAVELDATACEPMFQTRCAGTPKAPRAGARGWFVAASLRHPGCCRLTILPGVQAHTANSEGPDHCLLVVQRLRLRQQFGAAGVKHSCCLATLSGSKSKATYHWQLRLIRLRWLLLLLWLAWCILAGSLLGSSSSRLCWCCWCCWLHHKLALRCSACCPTWLEG